MSIQFCSVKIELSVSIGDQVKRMRKIKSYGLGSKVVLSRKPSTFGIGLKGVGSNMTLGAINSAIRKF